MSETLSQDEVDALLRGMAEGEISLEAEAASPQHQVRSFDLVGEERLLGRQFRSLDLIHDRFIRRLRQSLASFPGAPPPVEGGDLEILKRGTFTNRLVPGSAIHLFSMAPLRGQALLAISPPLAFGIVDRVFGGSGIPPATIGRREHSTIENQIILSFVQRVLTDLTESWASVHRVECSYLRTELNPDSLNIAGPADMILVLELGCDLGSGPVPLILALPYAMIEPVRAKLGDPQPEQNAIDQNWLGAMTKAIHDAELELTVELGSREISTLDALCLKVGDLLPLPTRGDDPITLRIEDVKLMTGLAGVSRGQNAVRVLALGSGD